MSLELSGKSSALEGALASLGLEEVIAKCVAR
jgi:hypothetical protein